MLLYIILIKYINIITIVKTMKHLRDWSLRSKILLHIIVIGILTAGILAFIYLRTQHNVILTMSRQKAQLAMTVVESQLMKFMEQKRDTDLALTIERISGVEGLLGVRIIDPEGTTLYSSDSQEVGTKIDKNILVWLEENSKRKAMFLHPQKAIIKSFKPIQNGEKCLRCHNPDQKILAFLEVDVDNKSALALLHKVQNQAIIVGLTALFILSLVIIRLYDKLLHSPFRELKKMMAEVEKGNPKVRLTSDKNDEIGSLIQSFNHMVRKLQESNHKIEKLYQKEIRRAEHLASIGELAAGLAHEIKNPLAGVKGALEVMRHQVRDDQTKREIFDEMLRQLENIDKTVQDLLTYARPKELKFCWVEPNECVLNAIKTAQTQTTGKKIKFEFSGLPDGTLAYLDPDGIQEVVLNLIVNSLTSIEKEGTISLTLERTPDNKLIIKVTDDGCGIPEEVIPHIFKPFFTTRKDGTGLGLSISKKIIEAHEGLITVESQPGGGTTFAIILPGAMLVPQDRNETIN